MAKTVKRLKNRGRRTLKSNRTGGAGWGERAWKDARDDRMAEKDLKANKKKQKEDERIQEFYRKQREADEKEREVEIHNERDEKKRDEAYKANKRMNELAERIEKIKKIKEETNLSYQEINDDLKNKLIEWYKTKINEGNDNAVKITEEYISYISVQDDDDWHQPEKVSVKVDDDKYEAMRRTGLLWPLTENELKSLEEVDPFSWPKEEDKYGFPGEESTMGGRRKTKRRKIVHRRTMKKKGGRRTMKKKGLRRKSLTQKGGCDYFRYSSADCRRMKIEKRLRKLRESEEEERERKESERSDEEIEADRAAREKAMEDEGIF